VNFEFVTTVRDESRNAFEIASRNTFRSNNTPYSRPRELNAGTPSSPGSVQNLRRDVVFRLLLLGSEVLGLCSLPGDQLFRLCVFKSHVENAELLNTAALVHIIPDSSLIIILFFNCVHCVPPDSATSNNSLILTYITYFTYTADLTYTKSLKQDVHSVE
jgi:hypothetical protein